METPENQEVGPKEVRTGRPPKTVVCVVDVSMTDFETITRVLMKKVKQTGEDVSRDRVISEAIQLYAKSLSAAE